MLIELLLVCLTISADDLPRPRTSTDDSAALRAAWDSVAETVPIKQGAAQYQPDAQSLAWFLGFVEGRTRVAPPNWWSKAVKGAQAGRRDSIRPGRLPDPPVYHRATFDFVRIPIDATLEKDGNLILYRVGDNKLGIPEELLDRADNGQLGCEISGCFTDRHLFVAVHSDIGSAHDVACLDRASGKLVWKATACGCWEGSATGQHASWVSVVPTDDDRVFVFGAALTGFYLHGFRASDGASLVRFSTK